MKACGVIVEYNPFHNGHKYHLKEAKKQSKADCVIAVMSGNWVQRGQAALIDKWKRASYALENGCDLVIELPPHYALQSADGFAKGGIKLLNDLQISSLCFGTDQQDYFDYHSFGQQLVENEKKIIQELEYLKHSGISYPQQMKIVYETIGLDGKWNTQTPNHLLGLTYAKEVIKQNPTIQLLPLLRKGSGYHEALKNEKQASASGIREALINEQWGKIQPQVPFQVYKDLKEKKTVSWNDFYPLLQYQVMVQSKDSLQHIYQMTEGLENRCKESITAPTFSAFIEKMKTKRYSYPRLSRLSTCILLQLTTKEMLNPMDYHYILGFTSIGQRYLRQIKKELSFPLISKPSKKTNQIMALNHKCDGVYQLVPGVEEQIRGKFPQKV